MLNSRLTWNFLIVLTVLSAETTAAGQSAPGRLAAVRLLDACRIARFTDVIFVGRPLSAVDAEQPQPVTVRVETAFRGVSSSTVQVSWRREGTIAPNRSYLMYGDRVSGNSVVQLNHYVAENDVAAQMAIQLFTTEMPQKGYVTLMGLAEVGSHPDRQPSLPLTGLRIRVRGEAFARDLFTQPNGTFYAAGIPPGRLELTPALPATLKVFDSRSLTYTAPADECVLEEIFVVSRERGY